MVSDSKIWKPVPSLKNIYEVSNCGDIRRVSVKTKLSIEDVDLIRSDREAGRSWQSIADKVGVSKMAVRKAVRPRLFSFRTQYRQLKPQKSSHGYPMLRVSLDGIPRTVVMHRLIVEVFLGPIPKDMEVNHKNGKRDDNRIENLEIVTCSENARHKIDVLGYKHIGLKGSACPSSKLNEANVAEIKALKATGHTNASLAERFGVKDRAIRNILARRSWKHCP